MPQVAAPTSSVWRREAYTAGAEQASNAPYLTSLANKCGLATKYWADTHPSLGTCEALAAKQTFPYDDGQRPNRLPLCSDDIAPEVQQADDLVFEGSRHCAECAISVSIGRSLSALLTQVCRLEPTWTVLKFVISFPPASSAQ